MIYDELRRKDWEEKIKSIPSFNVEDEAIKYNEEFVRRAKNVLAQRTSTSSKAPPPARRPQYASEEHLSPQPKASFQDIKNKFGRDGSGNDSRRPLKRKAHEQSGHWSGKGKQRHWVKQGDAEESR